MLGDTHTHAVKVIDFLWSPRKSLHKQKLVISFLGLKLANFFLVIHFRFYLTCVLLLLFGGDDDWQPSSRETTLGDLFRFVYCFLFVGFLYFFPLYISKKPELLKRLLFPSLLEREREMSRGRRRRRLSFMTSSFLVFSCLLLSALLSSSWSSIISASAAAAAKKFLSLSVTASESEDCKLPNHTESKLAGAKRKEALSVFLLSPFFLAPHSRRYHPLRSRWWYLRKEIKRKSTAPFGARLPTRSLLLSIEELFQMESDHHHLFLLIILSSGVPSWPRGCCVAVCTLTDWQTAAAAAAQTYN